MEMFLGFAAGPPLFLGVFVGLIAWFAWTVLRDTSYKIPILVSIAVSMLSAASLLVALGNGALILPGLSSYGLGLAVSSVFYIGVYRASEGHWPIRRRPNRSS